jgi:hypothetical protein
MLGLPEYHLPMMTRTTHHWSVTGEPSRFPGSPNDWVVLAIFSSSASWRFPMDDSPLFLQKISYLDLPGQIGLFFP